MVIPQMQHLLNYSENWVQFLQLNCYELFCAGGGIT